MKLPKTLHLPTNSEMAITQTLGQAAGRACQVVVGKVNTTIEL